MRPKHDAYFFMKIAFSIIVLICLAYMLVLTFMYLFQRSLLYYPVPYQQGITKDEISINTEGINLYGWILNPTKARALIYFGGNAEAIENNINNFETIFRDYCVYLVNYRGYGKSEGKPSESALFADALTIYDEIRSSHLAISVMGRSLGSGVAVYLASQRQAEKLILLTPYDSITEVAQFHYPFLPARLVTRDRFESFRYAPQITAPTLIVTAGLDQVVPVERALKLREFFTSAQVTYNMIESAAHNDVTEFDQYQKLLRDFIDGKPVSD
ncbi:MAG: alpha/beta hydrolase [Gammaproteobacteria bacterium]|nr:alpha/beta hydrolase [Gammaproteobacteria bacterium]